MNCQWQSLLCRVEAGLLNMFGEEEEEEEQGGEVKRERSPQYTVQLRGCEVRAGPDTDRSYRITLTMLDDQVAVLEVSGKKRKNNPFSFVHHSHIFTCPSFLSGQQFGGKGAMVEAAAGRSCQSLSP